MKRLILIFLLTSASIFSVWVYTLCTEQPIALKPDRSAVQGKLVWQKYNCTACHQLYGLGGYMGPDLTNEISRNGKDIARTFIQYGTVKMPRLHLSEEETENVIAFLAYVDRSGKYPALHFKANIYGNTVPQ